MQTPIWVWEEKIHRSANGPLALETGIKDNSFERFNSPASLFPYHSAYRNPEINATIQTVSIETKNKIPRQIILKMAAPPKGNPTQKPPSARKTFRL